MLLNQFDANAYIESATSTIQDGNQFFNQYLIHIQNPWDMISVGLRLLHKCYDADPLAYARIYKGGIYFYLGLASFRVQDYEVALFFIDNAVFSDIQAKIDSINAPSHAMRLIQLDSSMPEHKDFIGDAETRIANVIRIYNSRSGSKNLNLLDLREKFLRPAMTAHQNWRTLATTFISFCLEWNYRDELFTICPEPSTSESYFLHLFKGCLLFESLLKNNPKYPPKNIKSNLEQEIRRLQTQLGIDDKAKLKINGKTLDQILTKIDVESDESLPTAMQYTGWLRNTLGHNLGWDVSLTKNQYQRLFMMIASSCIHAVAKLYGVTEEDVKVVEGKS